MSTDIHSQKNEFLQKVEVLFSDINQWIKETGLATSTFEIEITEEAFGSYKSSKLLIKNREEREIAQIIPIGA